MRLGRVAKRLFVGLYAPTPVAFFRIMYLCYINESGTSEIPGNTSHFILAGLSIPIEEWKYCDLEIDKIKAAYGVRDEEIHVAWLLRPYLEQSKIQDFASLTYVQRRSQVETVRKTELLRLQRTKRKKQYRQVKKNYRETDRYIHLTQDKRRHLARDLANCISSWNVARLFAECIDKIHFDPVIAGKTIPVQSFEQVVSRFEFFLKDACLESQQQQYGILIHDNNVTVARKHTDFRHFHVISRPFYTIRQKKQEYKSLQPIRLQSHCQYL